MAKFFINRPIVAMVISIIMTILGLVAMVQLPIAQFPNIAPPEIMMTATYVGADAVTLEQSVATPIEQQVSGVDNMLYMYSVNANNGQMTLRVNFDINTKPNDDQILTQMRYLQAESQLPQEVRNYGVNIKKSTTSPLALFSLYSPNGTYDDLWLTNYAYININDPMSRVPGIGQVSIFGAGQYAMRFWVRPDRLAKLEITVPEILDAIKKQNTVNPAGQIGAEPVPAGQEFTYTVRAQGRLVNPEEFEQIVVRANSDGSIVRLKDVARIELGSQSYGNEKPAQWQTCRHRGHLPAPGIERDRHDGPGEEADGGDEGAIPGRPGVRDLARHDIVGPGRDQRDRAYPGGSAGARHSRRLHLPAGLARHLDSPAGRAGLPRRHLHALPHARVLDQHAVAVRPRAGHRVGRG